MNSFSAQIRELRRQKGDPLRTVAAFLDIDQAILSKIERGQRKASRPNVLKLAEYFHFDEASLLKAWLSDKIFYEIATEDDAIEILKAAEEKVRYHLFQKTDRRMVLKKMKDLLRLSGKIKKAWIYGSFARGEDGPLSDIDIAVRTDKDFSYFDLAEVQYNLEKELNRKIDIGFMDAFKPYIFENIRPDLKLVYER
ncbi:MAG: nucleotidyltransferase domain-containing protein [Bacteroidetes bacterium]|nr:nucleotidyltransferase domain-containing protein [Bacteroidota bacterium]